MRSIVPHQGTAHQRANTALLTTKGAIQLRHWVHAWSAPGLLLDCLALGTLFWLPTLRLLGLDHAMTQYSFRTPDVRCYTYYDPHLEESCQVK